MGKSGGDQMSKKEKKDRLRKIKMRYLFYRLRKLEEKENEKL